MKRDNFLEICKGVDFSAESNMEQNLEKLKAKILYEESIDMNTKRLKKPFTMVAVAAALLVISAVAVVASAPYWRRAEINILAGAEHISEFEVLICEETGATQWYTNMAQGEGAIIVEIDGVKRIMSDETEITTSLEDAKKYCRYPNRLWPTYIPKGFEFESATVHICPVRNPEYERAGLGMNLAFISGEEVLIIMYSAWDVEWGLPLWIPGEIEEITINGNIAGVSEGGVVIAAGEMAYVVMSAGPNVTIGQDVWLRVAEEMK